MSEEQICQTCALQDSGSIKHYGSRDSSGHVVIHSMPFGPCEKGVADYTVGEDGIMTYHPRPKWKTGSGNSNPRGIEQ